MINNNSVKRVMTMDNIVDGDYNFSENNSKRQIEDLKSIESESIEDTLGSSKMIRMVKKKETFKSRNDLALNEIGLNEIAEEDHLRASIDKFDLGESDEELNEMNQNKAI